MKKCKQEVVTYCDEWKDGSGLVTDGAILAVESVTEQDIERLGRLWNCDDLEMLDLEELGSPRNGDSYRIKTKIYNIDEDGNRELCDEKTYWVEEEN